MDPEDPSPNRYWYRSSEGYQSRSQRRLQEDLGMDEAAAETILHLRSQVVSLQSHIHQLEVELAAHETNQQIRLALYSEVYYEATWIEVEFEQ